MKVSLLATLSLAVFVTANPLGRASRADGDLCCPLGCLPAEGCPKGRYHIGCRSLPGPVGQPAKCCSPPTLCKEKFKD
jgi:hypothetical protein